jgi:hypothetical protein
VFVRPGELRQAEWFEFNFDTADLDQFLLHSSSTSERNRLSLAIAKAMCKGGIEHAAEPV